MGENLTPAETQFVESLHDLLDEDAGAVRAPKLFTRVLLQRGIRVLMAAIGAGPIQVLTTITVDDVTEEAASKVVERVLSRAGMQPDVVTFYARTAGKLAAQWVMKQRAARQQ